MYLIIWIPIYNTVVYRYAFYIRFVSKIERLNIYFISADKRAFIVIKRTIFKTKCTRFRRVANSFAPLVLPSKKKNEKNKDLDRCPSRRTLSVSVANDRCRPEETRRA